MENKYDSFSTLNIQTTHYGQNENYLPTIIMNYEDAENIIKKLPSGLLSD